MNNLRTHYAGEVSEKDINSEIVISGWVKKHRDLGELIFMDIRDISGICQVVINNENSDIFDSAKNLKMEYVVSVKGKVRNRQDINPNIPTGKIEIVASEIELINKSLPTPITIEDEIEASEETRMDYRYLDLRRPIIQEKLFIRSAITKSVRKYLDNNRFLEVETPILTKSTPEGARDYLVPSRVNHGEFYALPQSPQIYKNLLMIAGLDRYYQIVKCFRDEDLRAERQPEFTQIDIETSFLNEIQIRELIERMLKEVVKDVKGVEIKEDFPILSYDFAMDNYGNDKPDLRFDLKIIDVKNCFENSGFKVFKDAEYLRCLKIENEASNFSRKDIDKLEEIAKNNHAKGMAWMKFIDGELTGPIVKFLSEEEKLNFIKETDLKENDLVLFAADNYSVVCSSLSAVRNELGKKLNLINEDELAFAWIVDWPLFEYDDEAGRYFAMHHPFTMPVGEKFAKNPLETRAQAYDVVLNGFEIGGGSIRINKPEIQEQMFELLGFTKEEMEEQFGFLLDAYKYGAPYHGGVAFGLDRLTMLLAKTDSIRDVIAFPKNNKARELMINSPSPVSKEQLAELAIKTVEE